MTDAFSRYETGLAHLLQQMGGDHLRYADALVYQQRLLENIAQSRRYGDTEARRAERAQILDSLNQLALDTLGVSFGEICAAIEEGAAALSFPSAGSTVDDRSGGVYFEGPARIEGDVIGRDQTKITHQTHFHSLVAGPVHTGSGDIHIGSLQVGADASLETLLAALRRAVASQTSLSMQSKALQRVDLLAEALTESEPDLGLMESALDWFQEQLPSLAHAVVAVILHPAVVTTVETAGKPALVEFLRRFEGLGEQKGSIHE